MIRKTPITLLLILLSANCFASDLSDDDELRITALEALVSAPPERALPIVTRVLKGDHDDEVKESALFILSQIDLPEAQAQLLDIVKNGDGELQEEAIRMVGIGGDKDALAGLMDVYAAGNSEVREAVIEAYLIADDKDAIFEIAKIANSEEDFEEAVEALGAMDAREELRRLRESVGVSEALIDAYTIADDFDTLLELALDESDPEQQAKAVEALGVVGGDRADEALMEIYRNSDSEQVRESALDGMLISGNDVGVLELYRSSTSSAEKRMLLEYLVHMDSDEVWDIIDATLDGEQ